MAKKRRRVRKILRREPGVSGAKSGKRRLKGSGVRARGSGKASKRPTKRPSKSTSKRPAAEPAAASAAGPAGTERARDAARKRTVRAAGKDVLIPACDDRARRARLEADDRAWLMWYFGEGSGVEDPFWYEFTEQQQRMIGAIGAAIVDGGDKAIAASRGEGKTTLFERLVLKYTLEGRLGFSVLCAASRPSADDSLDTIKTALEENDHLAADYPEACAPVRALENTPSRAHYQTVSGTRHDNGEPYQQTPSKFRWCGQQITLPAVPGAPGAGGIIATRGLDSAVRGLKKKGRRVDLVGIDDPDTEDTARNPEQADKLERRIDRALGGLGGQQRPVARVMLTTLQNRICVSYRFTDPKVKPTWKGERFRFLVKPPARDDLWAEYVALRIADLQAFALGTSDDAYCRRSHQFYLDHRKQMDAGAAVANPHRFDGRELPDRLGQREVSSLERYHNEVARIGEEAVAAELDNDPVEESGPVESGITAWRIQRQLNGYPRKLVPPECVRLTAGVDAAKARLHYVVRAWRADGTGYTIDYGIFDVAGTVIGSDEGVDVAIERAVLALVEQLHAAGYAEALGTPRQIDRLLVDAGYRTQAVYSAALKAGLGVSPVMGEGSSAGCVRARYTTAQRATADIWPGDGYKLSRHGRLWLVLADADRWKAWEHDRWMTSPGRPGFMSLWGTPSGDPKRLSPDEKSHLGYAKHLTNEIEVDEPRGKSGQLRRAWKCKSDNVHYLDASYYSDVAAAIEGIRIVGTTAPASAAGVTRVLNKRSPAERPTLKDLKRRG